MQQAFHACINVLSQFVLSTLMCTFHPSGRPMASSHSPHLASETSLAAWKFFFYQIDQELWNATFAAASLLKGNLLNASVEYVPVLKRVSLKLFEGKANPKEPPKIWVPWQVVKDLSPASKNLPAGGEVVENLFHLDQGKDRKLIFLGPVVWPRIFSKLSLFKPFWSGWS